MTVTGSAHTAWMRFPTGHQIEHLATGYKMTVIPLFMLHPLICQRLAGPPPCFVSVTESNRPLHRKKGRTSPLDGKITAG